MSKYLETKKGSIESAVLEAMSPAQQAAIAISKKEKEQKENNYIHAAKMAKEKGEKTFTIGGKQYDVEEVLKTETNKNDKSDDGDGMDAVQPKAVKKKFADRKDKDIDNDGDVDDSDKFLHKRRKAVSKAMKKEEMNPTDHVKEKDGKFCVYNADGSIAKEFDNKEDADKYAIDNHDKLMATKKEEVELDEDTVILDLEDDDKKLMANIKKMGIKVKKVSNEPGDGYAEYSLSGSKSNLEKANKKLKLVDDDIMSFKEEIKEETLAMKAAKYIASMWEDSAKVKEAKVKEEEEEPKKKESKTAMTGKPMAGVEVNPKESKDK